MDAVDSVGSGSSGTACIYHTGELTSAAESEVGLGWVETVGSGVVYFYLTGKNNS